MPSVFEQVVRTASNTHLSGSESVAKRSRVDEKVISEFSEAESVFDFDKPYDCNSEVRSYDLHSTFSISYHHNAGNRTSSIQKDVSTSERTCFFNDPIHGNISMNGLCLRIIDTKEFQRLRELKQLGTCDFVYPGATHTRFAHSIGVAFCAETLVRNLQKNQPELNITEIDVLCVKVAGLCHDLGHGPFSHIFDGNFMRRMRPNVSIHHEDYSVEILRCLLQRNAIDVSCYGMCDKDILFIEEIIRGTTEKERQGRPSVKFYLYDIVNNSRSGLDVDKLDYFQRDIKYTNVYTNYNQFQRFIEFGRVMCAEPIPPKVVHVSLGDETEEEEEPSYMICYPEKMVGEALQLFNLRFHLHQKVYTHKSVKKVEYMLVDALEAADPYVMIPGSVTAEHPSGKYRMSECIDDPVAMSNLTDSVLYLIETSTDPNLEPAQNIIKRIRSRNFYACVGKKMYKRGSSTDKSSVESIQQEILNKANLYLRDSSALASAPQWDILHDIQSQDAFRPLKPETELSFSEIFLDDIIVEKMHTHYGLKQENPVNNMRFFPKDAMKKTNFIARMVPESAYDTLLPRVFEEQAIRVFCRCTEKAPIIALAFQNWCQSQAN